MEQAQYRISHHHDLLDVNIILLLQAMLHQYNPYMETFLTARECLNQNANISLHLKLLDLPHYDSRRYNHPTVNEIAVIMDGTGEEPTAGRDVVLQARSNHLQCIRETHSSYNPLRYPLLFPFGEQRWHINMFIFTQYLLYFMYGYSNCGASEDILHTKSLSVSIMHFSFTIGEINTISYIMLVYCFRNISSMLIHKLSNVAWTTFTSIKSNFDQKYTEGSWMPLYMG